jgi:heme oxygenase (mycobilin-producing)
MTMTAITQEGRTATGSATQVAGPVTLMNGFVVSPDRDEAFYALWSRTSQYFRAQPGFVSLRLHRAISPDATHRWVNVANWASEADYRAAHATEEFRRVVTQDGWQEFPSSPTLFEVHSAVG